MNQTTIMKVYALIDDIKSSKEYQTLKRYNQIIAKDEVIQTAIKAFQKAKKAYEEAKEYGGFHPNLKQRKITLSQAKESLYQIETVATYKELEKSLQSRLDLISKKISQSVSIHIPHPNELGIVQKESGESSCSNESV